jgi:hypothetical protein
MSAGIATYGTWKNAKAVAVARNATQTHTAPASPVKTPAKIDAKSTARAKPAKSRYGRRAPHLLRVRSEIRPASGFTTTSHALGRRTSKPATPAATQSVSVRYGRRSRPGTVPNAPVTRDPNEYPIRTRRAR